MYSHKKGEDMKAELMMELAEQRELEIKAEACDILFGIANNAIDYMYKQGMSDEDVAKYLFTTTDIIDAINNEDAEAIIN